MQIYLILAILLMIIAVVFAVQNVAAVTISFIAWNIHTSLAVALLVALGAGVLITILLSLPGRIKGSWSSASMKRKFSALEGERDKLQQKLDEITLDRDQYVKKWESAELEISSLEEQLANLSGAFQVMEENSKEQGNQAPSGSEPPSSTAGTTQEEGVVPGE